MLINLKKKFYNKVKSLGYNITDTGAYEEDFPWLMLRTGGAQRLDSLDAKYEVIKLTIDIFSTYPGEYEILNVVDNIADHLKEFQNENDEIINVAQTALKVLDDKSTGPVRKHGVVVYTFLCVSGLEEDEDDE